MTRTVTLLTAALAAGTAAPAAAQFVPFGGGFPSASYGLYSRSLYYATPFGGYSLSFQRSTYNFAVAPYPTYSSAGLGYSRTAGGTYLYGGGPAVAGNPAAFDRDAANLRRAQRAARNDPDARQKVFDAWAMDRGGKGPPADRPALPDAVRDALAAAHEDDVLSGKALNAAVRAILDEERKRPPAGRPQVFPPDLLAKAVYAGGPAADALNLFRGEVKFPSALADDAFDAGREAVAKAFVAVTDSLRAGKKLDEPALDRLAAAARKLKDEFAARGPAMTDEGKKATAFLDRLEAAATAARQGGENGPLVPSWYTVGASAADLARHLGRLKVEFAPAAADDDGGYFALHRGLTAYLADLARQR
jgi:hypothetical protein